MAVRVAVLLVLMGCGGERRGPYFDDDRFLVLGVDPDAEANALVKQFAERGYALGSRHSGRHFTALGFVDADGTPVAVRVVTRRGIGLALDREPDPVLGEVRFALLPPPRADTHDADSDGFEELFVERLQRGHRCIEVHRVRDSGFVDPVPVEHPLGHCPDTVRDVNADGDVELLVTLSPAELGLDGIEGDLQLPLWARSHRFVHDLEASMARFAVELMPVGDDADRDALLEALRRALAGDDSHPAAPAAKDGSAASGKKAEEEADSAR